MKKATVAALEQEASVGTGIGTRVAVGTGELEDHAHPYTVTHPDACIEK